MRDTQIKSFMSRSPRTLDAHCHFITAKKLMAESGFRHLPVVEGKKIIGILSARDIQHFEYVYRDRDIDNIRLTDVCLFAPYTVHANASLSEVLEKMIEDKIGSVIIEENGNPVGIFTTIDACKLLHKVVNK